MRSLKQETLTMLLVTCVMTAAVPAYHLGKSGATQQPSKWASNSLVPASFQGGELLSHGQHARDNRVERKNPDWFYFEAPLPVSYRFSLHANNKILFLLDEYRQAVELRFRGLSITTRGSRKRASAGCFCTELLRKAKLPRMQPVLRVDAYIFVIHIPSL